MSGYPCGDHCITYPICKNRANFQKFSVCTPYAEYVVSTIDKNQTSFDEEFGKGIQTVVGTATPAGDYIIDRNGKVVGKVDAFKGEL